MLSFYLYGALVYFLLHYALFLKFRNSPDVKSQSVLNVVVISLAWPAFLALEAVYFGLLVSNRREVKRLLGKATINDLAPTASQANHPGNSNVH